MLEDTSVATFGIRDIVYLILLKSSTGKHPSSLGVLCFCCCKVGPDGRYNNETFLDLDLSKFNEKIFEIFLNLEQC